MKTTRKFLFRLMLAVAALGFTFSNAKAADFIPDVFKPMYNPYFVTFPCYRVTSSISTDNTQITLYMRMYYDNFTYYSQPAPANLTVSLVAVSSTGSSPYSLPIASGLSQVTYSTGIPAGSYPGAYYNLTGISPGSYSGTAIYYDVNTVYFH